MDSQTDAVVQLGALSAQIDQYLTQLADGDDDTRDQVLPELLTTLDQRKACLVAVVGTDKGQDPEWLKFQLQLTQSLAKRAHEQLIAQQQRLGGYRKGRKQVLRYQQIEAGKG
ncbi:hypothetical protein [Ferrimonas pelagia]|uniref:Flagellar protein FliT n=1 Tax=Ferrimonas pelagia TaxID=1177826 RepID=A0ABP9EE36_9GAMM